jgi:pseudouridine synthase
LNIRLQKYLSEKNICSRRKAEEYIQKGWIKVNGKITTTLGTKINPETDKIEISKEIEKQKLNYTYLAFYKPRGILTNCAKPGEKQIKDLLPIKYQHLSCIGRLDKDSEGLILLTDDGVFTKKMLNQENPHEREYKVWVNISLTNDMLKKLENNSYLDGQKLLPTKTTKLSDKHFVITLKQGKNRQIRRMLQVFGATVRRLKRIRFGNIKLENLKPNEFKKI